ncbi:MAG TPA: cyclic pyranopterin monophosphate synthase MoaC [Acidimicrobiia bacterium]|nr:cyclic pyranopterin monophosphate synthase MoaC [Acidimicrobiia bacterium]HLE39389.1 cyclic pyranopterin monophosphate synthase MoaC [Acidimicrobiia bacterium]
MTDLSHLDDRGRARMVDVSSKPETERTATAEAFVTMSPSTREAVFAGTLPKGDALALVRVAAITGAKRTPDLVPLCHPLPLTGVTADVEATATGARIVVTAATVGRTGVEMEAITGAAVGAITLYDMIKGRDRGAEIGPVRLLAKRGGASGDWTR